MESETQWYPTFGLNENPFGVYDYAVENELYQGFLPLVETKAVDKIVNYAISKTNIILVGPKGGGKSVSVKLSDDKLNEMCHDRLVLAFVAPKTFADIYNEIWFELIGVSDEKSVLWDDASMTLSGNFTGLDFELWMKKRCQYRNCWRNERCKFINVGPAREKSKVTGSPITAEDIFDDIFNVKNDCPMKRHIIHRFLDMRVFRGKLKDSISLIDVPDDFIDRGMYGRRTLEELVSCLQKCGTVILIATNDQYKIMRKGEILGRLLQVQFPLPTERELKEIYNKRLEKFQKGVFKPTFTDEALSYLVNISRRIPREFIAKSCDVLTTMQEKGLTETATLEFAVESLGFGTTMTETDAIKVMLAELNAQGRVWVKIKEMGELLRGRGIAVTGRRLGRRLKNEWHLEHRFNPDSEYKVRP
ncbi:hypothetical protein E3J74_01545 [Candidatus Bathyarchaeota archaeon]|nr:MAG: hypothetical protein E3J74_01545 [Candidatus Bathyarchaeota archaeon]